ncbi:MAG: hypothetical protein GTN99_02965 [Candidatus Dadabacteria bacterium]|nr:hypothetical protein [Candidatus Dadabacteria bacterium]
MRIILLVFFILMIMAISANAAKPPISPNDDEELKIRFCIAWAQDAAQGTQKKMLGVPFNKLADLIIEIPDEVYSPDAKQRALSAVSWAYAMPFSTYDETEEIGRMRCMACVEQHNPQPCMKDFDALLMEGYSKGAF